MAYDEINNLFDANGALLKRDVMEAFATLVESRPTLMSLLRVGQPAAGAAGTKIEWPERILNEDVAHLAVSYAVINTAVTVAAGEGVKFAAGDTFSIEGHYDTTPTRQKIVFQVSGPPVGDVVPITVASGADTLLVQTNQKIRINKSEADGASYGTGTIKQGDSLFNYIQAQSIPKVIGKKNLRTGNAGHFIGNRRDLMADGLEEAMLAAMWQMEEAVKHGIPIAETSASAAAKMGGLAWFLEGAGTPATQNVLDAGANRLEESDINDLVEQLVGLGMDDVPGGKALMCSHANARRLYDVQAGRVQLISFDGVAGTPTAQRFATHFDKIGHLDIISHNSFDDQVVYLLSLDSLELVPTFEENRVLPLVNAWEDDTYSKGARGRKLVVEWEMSLRVFNPTNVHGRIVNIDPATP